MRVEFTFPDIQHPNGDITIRELATILESKYHILENFSSYIIKAFSERFLTQLQKRKVQKVALEEWLKNEWRQYIIGGKTGVKTNAALFRGDPSFVDTSSYYLSMQPRLIFNYKEVKILGIK